MGVLTHVDVLNLRDDGINPLAKASISALSWLITAMFNRDEIIALLALTTGDMNGDALRPGALRRRLAESAQRCARAGVLLDMAFYERLQPTAARYASHSMFELATLWQRAWAPEGTGLTAQETAAVLWIVASTPTACFRSIEAVIVDDLTVFCAQTFTQSRTSHDDRHAQNARNTPCHHMPDDAPCHTPMRDDCPPCAE